MFKIGDFSTFTQVTVKMLRHYDEIGLLKPAQVDPDTGYRYYAADQLPRLNRIIVLKDLGFSLEQIREMLQGGLSTEQVRGMLRLRRAEIENRLRQDQQRLIQLDTHLHHLDQPAPLYDVIVRDLPGQLMASIRQLVPSLGDPITQLFNEVEDYAAPARAVGVPFTLFHDAEYREENLDVEVAVPLSHPLPATERVRVGDIPGGKMACVVYTGNYDKMPDVLNSLLLWLDQHPYQMAGAIREAYLRFNADPHNHLPAAYLTSDPRAFVTEVQIPIVSCA